MFRRIFRRSNPSTVKAKKNPQISLERFNVEKMIDEELMEAELSLLKPQDFKEFNFGVNTRESWVKVLTEMAYWESKFKPDARYQENFRNSKGEYVISSGLFQVSTESIRGYGLKFTQEELFEPKKNIQCAIAIMTKLVKQDSVITGKKGGRWQGAGRYWSVLRGERDYTRSALAAIKGANL